MSINSITFLIFFAVVFLLLLVSKLPVLVRKFSGNALGTYRKILLLVASFVFYGWADAKFCLLLLALIVITWGSAILMPKKKAFLYIGIIIPLVILGFFKYFNFFTDSICSLLGVTEHSIMRIALPLGISFYTFRAISYIMDVNRGKLDTEKNFLNVALYISFFPQIVAGPIEKARDLIPQFRDNRTVTAAAFHDGIQIFVFGLFKKMVISDNLSVFVNSAFDNPGVYSGPSLLLAAVSYSLQLYCDFSGYSDMATGICMCLGYDIKPNFNLPYISKNVTEFWKRWHISLSSWLMEYLYFPLGGNRKGKVRTYINLFLTMVLGGLWHGANWTFVIWGALHGLALCVQKIFSKLMHHEKGYKGTPVGNIISGIFTFLFVTLCWIFFRADSFTNAWLVIKGICTMQSGITHIYTWSIFAIVVIAAATVIAIVRSKKKGEPITGFYPTVKLSSVLGMAIFLIMIGLTVALAYTGASPFIYAQF